MSREDVRKCIESAGIQCTHLCYPEGAAPELPWAVFYQEDEYGFDADDTRFAPAIDWCVELYQLEADDELEGALEEAITRDFGPYDKTEVWLDDENAVETTYTFRQIG